MASKRPLETDITVGIPLQQLPLDDHLVKKQKKLERKAEKRAREHDPDAQGHQQQGQQAQEHVGDVVAGQHEDDEAARARRKAERKAAKKADKQKAALQQVGESFKTAQVGQVEVQHGADDGDEERARKKARKELKKAEKERAQTAAQQEPALAFLADASLSAPFAVGTVAQSTELEKERRKKEKKHKKHKQKAVEPTFTALDPALAGLMHDFGPSYGAIAPSTTSHVDDIPVFESASTSHADDIPVDAAPSSYAHASTSTSASHTQPQDDVVAALTARALLLAKGQHEKELRDRREKEYLASLKSGKSAKDKKGKGKEGAIEVGELSVPAKTARTSVGGHVPTPLPLPTPPPSAAVAHPVQRQCGLGGAGDFYEILVSKWVPVKELKKMAEEQGATYKQGKFSASEDSVIRSSLDSFRDRKGLSHSDLVHLLMSKRSSATSGVGAETGHIANEAWEVVARALGDRSLLAIYNHVKRLYAAESGLLSGPWGDDEDERLRQAVKELGNQWEEIGAKVGGRSGGACRDRWTKQLVNGAHLETAAIGKGGGDKAKEKEKKKDKGKGKGKEETEEEEEREEGDKEKGKETSGQKKGRWSKEEEEELKNLYKEHKAQWATISRKMGGRRTPTQCRTKWNDFMVRREGIEEAVADADGEEVAAEASQSWRWKAEHASTLVHAVAALAATHESELNFKSITEPDLARQGSKNLRDRFRHLHGQAREKLAKERGVGKEQIGYQDALTALLIQHPLPGVAVKRTYAASEAKRAAKAAAKLARQSKRGHAQRVKLSAETIESDDEEGGGKGAAGARVEVGMDLQVGGDGHGDPLAAFNRGIANQLANGV
ncbi:hypothetical protein JCM11641_005896 [Rhodosporidiobolus odoratus]